MSGSFSSYYGVEIADGRSGASRHNRGVRLLVVEDDTRLASALKEGLEAMGHAVDVAEDAEMAEGFVGSVAYDLAVLDVSLPGKSGLAFCHDLRQKGEAMPVLMLTARDTLQDKVSGLDAGADDYVVKPFAMEELQARVRALLRRQSDQRPPVLKVGDLEWDPATSMVKRGGVVCPMPKKERALLEILMRHAGRVVTQKQLLDQLWDLEAAPTPETLRAHVKQLRKALGDTGEPRRIETIHGVGFRLNDADRPT